MLRSLVFFILAFLGLMHPLHAQEKDYCDKWEWLVGNWTIENPTIEKKKNSNFSFIYDFDKKAFVRKSSSGYPFTDSLKVKHHNDLMFILPNNENCPSNAVYIDNEEHKIEFSISYTEKSIILTGKSNSGNLSIRLSYTKVNSSMLYLKFEYTHDGVTYITFLEGSYKKV